MPDLLNISKDTVLAILADEEMAVKQRIERLVEHLREEVVTACEAIPHTKEPLNGAEAALSLDINIPYQIEPGSQVQLGMQGNTQHVNMHSTLDKGRYRAFIFLHKIPGGE